MNYLSVLTVCGLLISFVLDSVFIHMGAIPRK